MKTLCWIILLIFICGSFAGTTDTIANENKSIHDFLEKYNCLTYSCRTPKDCRSAEGGECIPDCPYKIRKYDTTTCPCGTTCCVWLP